MVDPLEILYQDDFLLAINKPAGLLVHPMKGMRCPDTLISRLAEQFDKPVWPVHRLDAPTSGVILCVFRQSEAQSLSEAFRLGSVSKTYYAIVRGWINEGTIEIPLQKYHRLGEFQEAETHYRQIKCTEIPVKNNRFPQSRYSLVEVKPATGRFHQIRRHLARIAHPVIGDTSHGDSRHNRIYSEYFGTSRLLLHSGRLQIRHPVQDQELLIQAPMPREMDITKKPYLWSFQTP